ncbi:hypothetical protein ACQP3J_29875, partial [Escherichia coli]
FSLLLPLSTHNYMEYRTWDVLVLFFFLVFSVSIPFPNLAVDDKHHHFRFLPAFLSMGYLPSPWSLSDGEPM